MKLVCLAIVLFAFGTVSCSGDDGDSATAPTDTTTPTDAIYDGSEVVASSPEEVMEHYSDGLKKKSPAILLALVEPPWDDASHSDLNYCLQENFNRSWRDDELKWETDSVYTENGATFVEGRLEVTASLVGENDDDGAFVAEVIERGGQWYLESILRIEDSVDSDDRYFSDCVIEAQANVE